MTLAVRRRVRRTRDDSEGLLRRALVALLLLTLASSVDVGALGAQNAGRDSLGRRIRLAPDTSGVAWPFAEFAARVLADHPVAVQARQTEEAARAELTMAWGAFDPKLEVQWDRKRFKDTPYFTYLDAAFKVPLPIGSDIKLGYERARGDFINPDRTVPARGLLSLGLSIPLGQGIITDERRAALTQARAARDAGEAERQAMLNKLLLQAAKDYGAWYEAWQRVRIAREGLALASFRDTASRERVQAGDAAPIDTVEAVLEVRKRRATLAEATAELFASRRTVEAYLWDAQGRPVAMPTDARPELDVELFAVPDSALIVAWREAVQRSHPDLVKTRAKVQSAEAERLLATQGIIPFAEASLASLADNASRGSLGDRDTWGDSHKASLSFAAPLLFLKERGKFGATGAKLAAARAERDLTRRLLGVGVDVAANDLAVFAGLRDLQTQILDGARLLRDAEELRFLNGESTLLTVNLRERLVLDEAAKLAQLEAKLLAARAALAAAVGDPGAVGALLP